MELVSYFKRDGGDKYVSVKLSDVTKEEYLKMKEKYPFINLKGLLLLGADVVKDSNGNVEVKPLGKQKHSYTTLMPSKRHQYIKTVKKLYNLTYDELIWIALQTLKEKEDKLKFDKPPKNTS